MNKRVKTEIIEKKVDKKLFKNNNLLVIKIIKFVYEALKKSEFF